MTSQQEKESFAWHNYDAVILDFDGVIKESVQVKSQAFYQLFEPYGRGVAEAVVAHHEANGGMSRTVKMPLYLTEFADEKFSEQKNHEFLERFRLLTQEATVASAWVPGVLEFIHTQGHGRKKRLFVASGTPQAELEELVYRLDLHPNISGIFGYPPAKKHALAQLLKRSGLEPARTVFVGDSVNDFAAARANDLPFVWRRKPGREGDEMELEGPHTFVMDDFASGVAVLKSEWDGA